MSKKKPILSNFKYANKLKTRLEFQVSNFSPLIPLANAIRRAPGEVIPVVSIHQIEWFEPNKTSAIKEMIDERLKQIPIYNEDMDQDELEKVTLHLNVTSDEDEGRIVTSGDFKVDNMDKPLVDPRHIIVILKKNQSINLSCRLRKGMSIESANYWPGPLSSYFYPEPPGQEPKAITITIKAYRGCFKPQTILQKSIEGIKRLAQNLARALEENNEEKIAITNIFEKKYEVTINQETWTLTNLLAQMLSQKPGVIYSQCNEPHPNLRRMIIQITLGKDIDPNIIIAETLKDIETLMDRLVGEINV